MILYHYDRFKKMNENTIYELDRNFSKIALGDEEIEKYLHENFSEGLSQHGCSYVNEACAEVEISPIFMGDMFGGEGVPLVQIDDIRNVLLQANSAVIDQAFELVRRISFPELPSRLQSLFCFGSMEELRTWDGYSEKEGQVFEIEASENKTLCLDMSLVKGGFDCNIFSKNSNDGLSEKSLLSAAHFNAQTILYANKYWSGEKSDYPIFEHLVEYPIKVLNRVEV